LWLCSLFFYLPLCCLLFYLPLCCLFFYLPLCCLFFYLRLLVTPLVSSGFLLSCKFNMPADVVSN
jgi:hypothetical protein